MVVGITGGIGSGKTTVVKIFEKLGNIASYITDFKARKMMETTPEIKTAMLVNFGQKTYKNNRLDRKYLANIVFKDTEKLKILNGIVHPVVLRHFKDFVQKNIDKAYIIYENAILFENGSDAFCDKIVTVIAPKKERIKRIIRRDKTTEKYVLNRINNQWTDDKKILQSHYIIQNNSIKKTLEEVINIHYKLIKSTYTQND